MECISSHISLEAFEDAPFSSCNPSIFQTLSGTFEVGTNGNLPISPEVGPKVGTNGNLPIFPEVDPEGWVPMATYPCFLKCVLR
jgi:hypothetical protein